MSTRTMSYIEFCPLIIKSVSPQPRLVSLCLVQKQLEIHHRHVDLFTV